MGAVPALIGALEKSNLFAPVVRRALKGGAGERWVLEGE